METSILTSKGQILIPKRLRTKYGIKSGIKVAFLETPQGVVLKPMDDDYFENLAGSLKDMLPSTTEYKKIKQDEKSLEEKKLNEKFKAAKK